LLNPISKARILRALRGADLLGPFAAGYLEEIARLGPEIERLFPGTYLQAHGDYAY